MSLSFTSKGLEEDLKALEGYVKSLLDRVLNEKGMLGPKKLDYYNFVKEAYKKLRELGLLNSYSMDEAEKVVVEEGIKRGLDEEVMKNAAKFIVCYSIQRHKREMQKTLKKIMERRLEEAR
jgi:hypothetical protein